MGQQVGPAIADPLFDRDTFKTTPVICPFAGQVDYEYDEVSCGLLEVPENREAATTRRIELLYVKISARPEEDHKDKTDTSTDRADPIIYLTGGPGVAVLSYVRRLKNHGVVDHRDLYILEQRGIANSGDFCPFFSLRNPLRANASTAQEAQADAIARIADCFRQATKAGVDLSAYSTIENARDVKALRIALGFDDWNVWGISYGSVLGQAYLREDPQGIRAAVLDAIVPLAQDINFFNVARYFDRDVKILSDLCADDETCRTNFPDMGQQIRDAILAVDREPITVRAANTEAFPKGTVTVLPSLVAGLPFSLFYEQDNYPYIPAVIDALDRVTKTRDVKRFELLGVSKGVGDTSAGGMSFAIYCNDGWIDGIIEAGREEAREFPILSKGFFTGLFEEEDLAQGCEPGGIMPRPAEDYVMIETDIPTIIAEGRMDPITPPPLAETILPGFSNGTYVEFPYAGHGPTRSVACAGTFLTKFYDAPNKPVDTSCADDMEPPTFSGPLFLTDAPARLLALGGEDPRKLMLPGLWGGLSGAILVLGALIYTMGGLARSINQAGKGKETVGTTGARPLAWLTALTGAVSVVGLGAVVSMTAEANEALLLFGLLPAGEWFTWPGLAAGVFGLVTLVLAVLARRRDMLPIGTLVGLGLTGLAGVAYATFLVFWNVMPMATAMALMDMVRGGSGG